MKGFHSFFVLQLNQKKEGSEIMAYQTYGYPAYSPIPSTYQPRQEYAPQAIQQPVQAQQVSAQVNAPGFACRPVTSREEALGVLVDYFAAGTVMPDLAHGRIYLKKFNSDTGASNFYEFAIVQPTNETAPETPDYPTILQNVGDRLAELFDKIDSLDYKLDQQNKPKGRVKNDE